MTGRGRRYQRRGRSTSSWFGTSGRFGGAPRYRRPARRPPGRAVRRGYRSTPRRRYGSRRTVGGGLPRARLAAVIAVLVVGTAGLLIVTDSSPASTDRAVLVVATGSGNEATPELPEEGRQAVADASLANGSATLLAVDGDGTVQPRTFDLTPRRGDEEEHAQDRRRKRAKELADQVADAVREVTAGEPGHALLAGLQEAARLRGDTVVVVSSGVDVRDPLDLRKSGWDVRPKDVADYLRRHDSLPDLHGRTVLLALSPVAGPQPRLDESARRHLETLWRGLLREMGATVQVVPSASHEADARTGGPPVYGPTVPVPVIPTPVPSSGCRPQRYPIPSEILFRSDRADLLDPAAARRQLRNLAGALATATETDRSTVSVIGHTSLDAAGPHAGFPLSRQRAQVVRDLLVSLGVPKQKITRATGVGPAKPLIRPATDPRNRAVEIVVTPACRTSATEGVTP